MKKYTPSQWMNPLWLTILAITSFMSCTKNDPGNAALPSSLSKSGGNSGKAMRASAQVAHDWYNLQLKILLERNSAFNGAHYAYIGIGLYEAVKPGIRDAVSLSSVVNTMPAMPQKEDNEGYDYEISANAVMADMTRKFFNGLTIANNKSIDSLESAYNESLTPSAGSASAERSKKYGKAIADAVYNWFLTDNFNGSNAGYIPPAYFGAWEPTPPAFANGVNPYLGNSKTLYAGHTTMVSKDFPFAYSEVAGSDFYNMVKQLYDISKTLTQEQKNTALYWVDQGNNVGYTPPGHDFKVIVQALEQKGVTLDIAAEAYAKAGIAERDASVVIFRSKYKNFIMRPITYIRKVIEPGWNSFITTPPHPEYPAAHAGITGSVMQAVAEVIGENTPVTDRAYEFRGFPARTYPSLFKAAEEAGYSRLYGGIHYELSILEGLSDAKTIGKNIGDLNLKN